MARAAAVVGASSGIGAATARALARAGFDTVLLARRAERIERLAGELGGVAIACDVTSEADLAALAQRDLACDVLVNCAGGAIGAAPVHAAAPADWAAMYEVNVLGLLRVTQVFLPTLRDRAGTIVNVTSTAALQGYEGGAGYCGAKSAARSLTQALRLELSGEAVRVVQIAPGMVRTEEFALNRFAGDASMASAVYEGVDRPLVAEDVAECILFACTVPQHVNIDEMVVRPVAQAAQHKLHRGTLDWKASPAPTPRWL